MNHLMKNMLHKGYDVERFHTKMLDNAAKERREKRRRREERQRVYIQVAPSELSTETYSLLDMVEGNAVDVATGSDDASGNDQRGGEAIAAEVSAGPDANHAEITTTDKSQDADPTGNDEDESEEVPTTTTTTALNENAELDSLSRAVSGEVGDAVDQSADRPVLPDFEEAGNTEMSDSILSSLFL